MNLGERNETASGEVRAPLRGHERACDDDSLCLDLPPEFEDPEGWMSERRDYWIWLDEVGAPTRASWLRHRWVELFERVCGKRPNKHTEI